MINVQATEDDVWYPIFSFSLLHRCNLMKLPHVRIYDRTTLRFVRSTRSCQIVSIE